MEIYLQYPIIGLFFAIIVLAFLVFFTQLHDLLVMLIAMLIAGITGGLSVINLAIERALFFLTYYVLALY